MRLSILFILVLAASAFSAPPPIRYNSATTNNPPIVAGTNVTGAVAQATHATNSDTSTTLSGPVTNLITYRGSSNAITANGPIVAMGANTVTASNMVGGGWGLTNIGARSNSVTVIGDTPVTGGTNATAVGSNALAAVTTGQFIVAVGDSALESLTTANDIIGIGTRAGRNFQTGGNDVFIGTGAGYFTEFTWNTCFVGHHSGLYSGAVQNSTALGALSLRGGTVEAGNTVGWDNTAIGYFTLPNVITGSNNTSVGSQSGTNINAGSFNTFLGSLANSESSNHVYLTVIGAGARGNTDNAVILGRVGDRVAVGTNAPTAIFDVQDHQRTNAWVARFGEHSILHSNGNWSVGGTVPLSTFFGAGSAFGLDGGIKIAISDFGISSLISSLDSYASMQLHAWSYFLYNHNGDVLMKIENDGQVGIGTNSPQAAEHIVGNGSVNDLLRLGTTAADSKFAVDTNGNVNATGNMNVGGTNTAGVVQIGMFTMSTNQGTNLVITTPIGTIATVTTNGNFGIGTTPSASGSGKLNINSAFVSGGAIQGSSLIAYGSAPNVFLNDSTAGDDDWQLTANSDRLTAQNADSTVYGFTLNAPSLGFVQMVLGTNVITGTNAGSMVASNNLVNNGSPTIAITAQDGVSPAHFFVSGNSTLQKTTVNPVPTASVANGSGPNPVGCYGALMMNATNIVVCAGANGVYTNASGTGYTTMVTNGFYGATSGVHAALTNLVAGWYRVTISESSLGAASQVLEWEVFTNQVGCDLISFKKAFDNPARFDACSATGVIYLPALTRIAFKVQDFGTGSSVAVNRAQLVIGTP